MKNRSFRNGIKRLRPSHRHNYTKHKMYVNTMMIVCTEEYLSRIWSSIHEKVK